MAEAILLGLDVGTSAVKAAVFDARTGKPLASAIRKVTIDGRADGAREVDSKNLLASVRRCVGAVARQAGSRWKHLSGAGLAAQGGSGCLFDRKAGRPRTPMQLWNDSRPLRILPVIAAQRPPSYWPRLALLDGPGAGLARLTWLRDQAPSAWDDDTLYGGAGEYLYFHLTGRWRQDVGNALQIGCYDVASDRLTDEPLSLVDAGLENVAPLRCGHETHPLTDAGARFLGCRTGIPVAGPYMDHEAGFLAGAASVGTDVLQCSLGTAWVGSFLQRRLPPPPGGMNLVLPAPLDRGRLVVRVLPAGSATLDWAISTLGGGRRRAERVLADAPLPPSHLVAMPWLTWPNPFGPSGGGGGLLGLDVHTRRDDMLRASVAGLCFAFRHVLEPVVARNRRGTVLLTGGASRSESVRRLLAALLAPLVVRYSQSDELAGAGGCVWTFQKKAARFPCRTVRTSARLIAQAADSYEHFRTACTTVASGLGDAAGLPLITYRRSTRI